MGAGVAKRIDPGALGLVLDNLQRYQYQFPIRSTTRELLSNAVDSIKEKHMARSILSGKSTIEDYFVKQEEVANIEDSELYKDSSFDPTYYDLNYLSNDDKIELRYIVGGNVERDRVVFTDYGVGLGGKRLEGYFSMGYSTKRLSKMPLGKWGIGAKSPLSVGVSFYTVESRYNGKLFRFNVYSHSFDSIIPQFDLSTKVENQSIKMFEGTPDEYTVYYESTDLPNSLVITIDNVKKAHKNQYLDAVKSQMLYFGGISLVVVENDREEHISYEADIFYEDDYIILSNNTYYSKPHLLLNKVNYGYIDWAELELQDRVGNVGIKVAPEDVEVSPSRENVIWSDKTKEMVNKRFTTVKEIATRIIQESLKGKDLLKWLKTCNSVKNSMSSSHPIVGRLANLVDVNDIDLTFDKDSRITYGKLNGLTGLYIREITLMTEQKANKYRKVVKRKEHKNLNGLLERPIVLITGGEKASNRKDKYLLSIYPRGFVAIYEPFISDKAVDIGISESALESLNAAHAKMDIRPHELWDMLLESKEVIYYEALLVPEDFKGTEESEEEDTTTKTEEDKKSLLESVMLAQERRKLENKILMYTPRAIQGIIKRPSGEQMMYQMGRMEIKISDINSWEEEEIYYGGDGDEEMMHLAAMLTRDPDPENVIGKPRRSHAKSIPDWEKLKWFRLHGVNIPSHKVSKLDAYLSQHFFDNKEIKLIAAARANHKYLRDFQHIQRFFITIKNNVITMSSTLIKWNTARIVSKNIDRLKFLTNFPFNSKLAGQYQQLTAYVSTNYRSIQEGFAMTPAVISDLINHLDNVQSFQEFVREETNQPDLISEKAKQLFGNSNLKDGHAVDMEIMDILKGLLDYAAAAGSLLNHIDVLLTENATISEELEFEIRTYLEYKDVLNYDVSLSEDSSTVEISETTSVPVEDTVGEEVGNVG